MRRWLPLALLALLAATLLPGRTAVGALDWREARDAVIARETAVGYDQYAPQYALDPYFAKPLAGYALEWLASPPGRGRNAHPPSTLAHVARSRTARAVIAGLLALLVAAIGTRLFGERAGWLGACAFASSVGLPLAARADGTQLFATLCAWLGAGGLIALVRGGARPATVVRLAAWTAIGAAMLVGGPLPALWPLAGFALYFALARARDGWREIQPFAGLAVVAGMALPWYGVMTSLHGTAFVRALPGFPYADGVRGSWASGLLLAFSAPLILGFPWIPMLGASLRDAAARLRRRRVAAPPDLRDPRRIASLLLAMTVAGAVPVALYPGAPLTAALPALPAVAMLCGRFLDRVLEGDVDAQHLTGATRLNAFLGTTASLLAMTFAQALEGAAPALHQLAAALFVTSWLPLLADFRGHRRLAAALFALPVAIGAPIVMMRVLPPLEPWLNARGIAQAFVAAAPPNAALVLFEPPPPSLRLELGRNLVTEPDPAAAFAAEPPLASIDGRVYVAFRPALESAVAHAAATPLQVISRTPALVLASAPGPVALRPAAGEPPRAAARGRAAPPSRSAPSHAR